MSLIVTRDKAGRVIRVELDGVAVNDAGRVELPFVHAVQVTDKPSQLPTVGMEFGIGPGFALVQATEGDEG